MSSLNTQRKSPRYTVVFSGTVDENIRYGRLTASDDEILTASRFAEAHDFIQQLKNGYNTELGPRGVFLSGGQRQRISIARAILKNAPILILDEATSALDLETEKKIYKGLQHLISGRTTIIIAHRLSTITNADRILYLENGEIAEEGDHRSLLIQNGLYARMFEQQKIYE